MMTDQELNEQFDMFMVTDEQKQEFAMSSVNKCKGEEHLCKKQYFKGRVYCKTHDQWFETIAAEYSEAVYVPIEASDY